MKFKFLNFVELLLTFMFFAMDSMMLNIFLGSCKPHESVTNLYFMSPKILRGFVSSSYSSSVY